MIFRLSTEMHSCNSCEFFKRNDLKRGSDNTYPLTVTVYEFTDLASQKLEFAELPTG